jgi:hypothetical protein
VKPIRNILVLQNRSLNGSHLRTQKGRPNRTLIGRPNRTLIGRPNRVVSSTRASEERVLVVC